MDLQSLPTELSEECSLQRAPQPLRDLPLKNVGVQGDTPMNMMVNNGLYIIILLVYDFKENANLT